MGSDPNDYTKKYPKDAVGDEMSPNGRFWRTYLDEAYIFDGERLDGYQDTVDILLIFVRNYSLRLLLVLTKRMMPGRFIFCSFDDISGSNFTKSATGL